eukprot:COSAG03_NODE_4881_length_1405_cov_0.971669_1_plen_308_part_00
MESPLGSALSGAPFERAEILAVSSLLMSTLAVILLATMMSQMSDVADQLTAVSARTTAFIDKYENPQSSNMADMMTTTFDEGRLKMTLASGIALAQKAANIDWSLDASQDPDLCYTRTFLMYCSDRPQPFCDTGGRSCQGSGADEVCSGWGDAVFVNTEYGNDGNSCGWDASEGACREKLPSGAYAGDLWDQGMGFPVATESCPNIDPDDSAEFTDALQEIIDLMNDLTAGLSSDIVPGMEGAVDLNKGITALFNADWAKVASTCEKMLEHSRTVDLSVFLSDSDEEAWQAVAHFLGVMCAKVVAGF